jgi:hypothetical protein
VQYFFLDLAHLLEEEVWADLVDNLIKFPSAFSLPPSIIKLTQVPVPSSCGWLLVYLSLVFTFWFGRVLNSKVVFTPLFFNDSDGRVVYLQAFWLLDHEDWEDSVSMMLDPLLQVLPVK